MNTESKQDESIFILRAFRIGYDPSPFIKKRGLGFFKGDVVFGLIGSVLFGVPLESKLRHPYSVNTL